MDEKCVKCGKKLTADDIGATKKFIGKAEEEFFCLGCLAERFKVTREYLEEKIEYLRNSGCTLFPK